MKALPQILLVGFLLSCGGAALRAQALPEPIVQNFYPPELVRVTYPALNLTDDQKATLQAADERISNRIAQNKKAIAQETARLATLVKAEKLDSDAILAQTDRILALEQDSQRATLALMLKIRETLTPEQQAKLKDFKAKAAGFQAKVRQAMDLAQQWKQEGRDLSEFEGARSEFESLMAAGDFPAAEALLNKTLARLQAPAPKPKP